MSKAREMLKCLFPTTSVTTGSNNSTDISIDITQKSTDIKGCCIWETRSFEKAKERNKRSELLGIFIIIIVTIKHGYRRSALAWKNSFPPRVTKWTSMPANSPFAQ